MPVSRAGRTVAWIAAAALAGSGCGAVGWLGSPAQPDGPGASAEAEPLYTHSRYDYYRFLTHFGRLPEPNYLPFLTHEETLADGRMARVVCRWADEDFPLSYWIHEPEIPDAVQDEFHPRDPREYITAVERAFVRWEEAIGRPVRFVRAEDPEAADLSVRLRAPVYDDDPDAGDWLPGGVVHAADRCRIVGEAGVQRARIEFSVGETEIFVTDPMGLWTPRQVHGLMLHEVGHILGASGEHSPLRGDVMYRGGLDRKIDALSEHDRQSFRALYAVPPGAIYAHLGEARSTPVTEVRRSAPRLDRLRTDERFDLEFRLPVGWQAVRSPSGWVGVDGLTWDYGASIQVLVVRGDVRNLMARQQLAAERAGDMVHTEVLEIDGQPVGRLVARGEERTEEIYLQQWGSGEVLVLIADCWTQDWDLYTGWFRRVLLSVDSSAEPRFSDVGAGAGEAAGKDGESEAP